MSHALTPLEGIHTEVALKDFCKETYLIVFPDCMSLILSPSSYPSSYWDVLGVKHYPWPVRQRSSHQWLPAIHRWPLWCFLPICPPLSFFVFQPQWSLSWFMEHSNMLLPQTLTPLLGMVFPPEFTWLTSSLPSGCYSRHALPDHFLK